LSDEQNIPQPRRHTQPTTQPGIDMEAIFQMIAKMDENNQKNLMLAISEMKKPTTAEQKIIDEKDARTKQHQEARLKMAQAEEQRKASQIRTCAHATTHPGTGVTKHSWRAQVHTPAGEKPYFVPTCQQCLTQLPKILATTEMLTQGVNLDQYAGIDMNVLKNWAAQTAA